MKALDGGAAERVLPRVTGPAFGQDWSPDGRLIVYAGGTGGRDGLWAVKVGGDGKPLPLVPGGAPHDAAKVSPDGRFLAYMDLEAGRFEIYVQEFPAPRTRARFSSEGGAVPRWRGDGRELFYLAPDGALMAVDVEEEATLKPGVPRKLFSTGLGRNPHNFDLYAATADGQRFLVLMPVDSEPAPITVVLNWAAGLVKSRELR